MKSRILAAALLTLTFALGACSDATDQAGAGASGAASNGVPASSGGAGTDASAGAGTSAGPNTDPSSKSNSGGNVTATDALVTFTRTGGLAGNNDSLVVKPDGSYTITTKQGTKTGKLTDDEANALKTALASTDFNKLPTMNDNGAVADAYTYTVTYGGKQITAKDGSIPPALQPVVSALGAFLSK
ncbi:protealysin inhibitor emfourin [Dactylosporangium sp. NPDC000244]|uniref:protealysin inhibitor emfourin n=1 Tax=Dactylosporangium sp. NPDC000244 TaxID=3154365 RepID=UPI003331826C